MTSPTSEAAPRHPIRTAQSHCYVHPDRRAVAVCSVCDRGVCRLCRTTLKGRNYCHADAEVLQVGQAEKLRKGQLTTHAKLRRNLIWGAAALAAIDGLAGGVVGFMLIFYGLLEPEAKESYSLTSLLKGFFTFFSAVSSYPASQAVNVGLFVLSAGLVGIAAAILLYYRSRIGGVVCICIAVLGAALVIYYRIIFALAGGYVYVYVLTAAATVVLVVMGWKYLDRR